MHIAIDCGRYEVKVIGANGYHDHFPSYIGESRELKLVNVLRETDIILRTSEGSWFVGSLAKDESNGAGSMMTANKVHADTKLLILAAVARATKGGEKVIVTTGVPVRFHSAQTKQELNNLLVGKYSVSINHIPKTFEITKVNIVVEGPSAYTTLCAAQLGIRRFVDIGSRTVNYGTVVNGRYNDRESDTLDYGYDTIDADARTISRRIATDLSRVWMDLSADTYVFGGGAITSAHWLRDHFPRLITPENPQWVNVQAFYAIGEKANGAMVQQARILQSR